MPSSEREIAEYASQTLVVESRQLPGPTGHDASFLQDSPHTHTNKGAIGPKGVKGGSGVGPPRGYFGRNPRIWLETGQPMRQKAIQGLLSRFRRSPGPLIFDGFLADLNRALSALFSKIGPQKIENSPSPGVKGRFCGLASTQSPQREVHHPF